METNRVIQEWLTEYKSLPSSEASNFGNKVNKNKQLIKALLEEIQHSKAEIQDPVFSQLYELYRSGHLELKRFTLQFVPVLIWRYLTSIVSREGCGRLESLLLGIYNLEVVEPDGSSRVESFTIPTLAKPSIYHEPMSQLALTENVLSYQQSDHWAITRGPFPQLKAINSQNRFEVLTHVLAEYNADIRFLSSESHEAMCNTCSRLAVDGFENIVPSSRFPSKHMVNGGLVNGGMQLNINEISSVRVPLTAGFMVEMVNAIYFAMFNGLSELGIKSLEDIHFRAGYELYTDVLLSTNAIKHAIDVKEKQSTNAIRHSLDVNPSGKPGDGPVGVNVTITPPSPKVKRHLITNASFKINRQHKAMIQVTIEGADSPPANKVDTSMDTDSVDVAVVDGSGKTKVQTVEMKRVGANGENKRKSTGTPEKGSPVNISPASHSTEIHMSTNHEVRNAMSYETTL